MARASRLAKLSAPRMARLLRRPRLFRLLDRARRRGVLWIVAPPGAGKTALVATWLRSRRLRHAWMQLDEGDGDVATFFHYLSLAAQKLSRRRLPVPTPELLASPGGFARLFLRALCTAPTPPAVIVLDDYHQVRSDSLLHAALRDGLVELPEGVTTIVVSRSDPPAPLARLQANGLLEVFHGDELALTRREAEQIGRLWGYSERERGTVLALHARTEGWVAGLVLLLSAWRPRPGGPRRRGDEQALFDYFAQEVLDRLDHDTRRVLIETALLPRIEGPVAVRLTGIERAEEILASLAQQGCFVVRHDAAYRYHDLFREFLLGRASKALAPDDLAQLQRSAARLLEERSQLGDAFRLYAQAGAWADAARMARSHAPLLLRQARAATVASWVECLPADVRDADPWLLVHLGEALSSKDPRAALGHLERAYGLFRGVGDGQGACLAWAMVVETHFFGLSGYASIDRWLPELDDLCSRYPDLGSPEVEGRFIAAAFTALCQRQPWHPALPAWERRALAFILEPGNTDARVRVGHSLLFHYAACVNDLDKGRLVLETLRPIAPRPESDPLTAIDWYACEALLHVHAGRARESRQAASMGLSVSARTGIGVLDAALIDARAFADVLEGDLVSLERTVEQASRLASSGTPFEAGGYHLCAFLLARRKGDERAAREHSRIGRRLVETWGIQTTRLLYVSTLLFGEALQEVEGELEKTVVEARRFGSRFVLAQSSLGLALAAMHRSDDERAVTLLRDGFAAARDLGCVFFAAVLPSELADCCALALAHGIEPEYARELIRVQRLAPGPRARDVAQWPWDLRIEALQGFALRRDGTLLEPGRKVQKKPQELLKLLVARGPGGMHRDALAEALWPEAEGDAAQQSLKATLHRVRGLLGSPEAVAQRDERVALDPARVFVDAWALERLVDRLESPRTSSIEREALRGRLQQYRADEDSDVEDSFLGDLRRRLGARMQRCLRPPA